ncbi:MAG: single-stranded-DNA-specific exonuclease RecJ [Oscillospiraceae bacterium]|nr:single-stranded-DNA-specific exonuclease RecJ [Oscillospiraceae bacterium]
MSRKKWTLAHIDKDVAASVAETHSLDPFTALILTSRGITEYEDVEEFFDPDFAFCDSYLIRDVDKAVERIKKAIENYEKICVFGDYDADGVTSTALMYSYLRSVGADVTYYIPDRVTEGYGMNVQAVKKIAEDGTKLIVTVDNGISAIEEIDFAKSLGVDVVVTDHHKPGETLPDAVAVVDPHRDDDNLPFRDWAGVGVAFKVVSALNGGDCMDIISRYADIIAVGTIADVVDLRDENRAIVRYGVAKINSDPCFGIEALKQISGVGGKYINSVGVTYSLAPRINAAGRMASAETALKLLLSEDENTALEYAEIVDECNRERHTVENEITKSAISHIENDDKLKYAKVIVICGEGWHHGVIGIVAARITEKYGKPSIVISFDGDEGTGSARSIDGFSVYDAIKSCDDLLTHFGGHTMAAGLGIKKENVNEFFNRINEYANSVPSVIPELLINCKLNPAYINNDLLSSLSALEPYGAGNSQPVFGIYGVTLSEIKPVGESGKHLRLTFTKSGAFVTAMKFSTTAEEFPYCVGDILDLAVRIDKNEFKGEVKPSVQIKDIRFSGTDEDKLFGSMLLFEKFKRGEELTTKEAKFITPSRDFLLGVYKFIKQQGSWNYDTEVLLKRTGCQTYSFCTMQTAIDILCELGLLKLDDGKILFEDGGKKVELADSKILNRLNSFMGGDGNE